LFNQPIFPEIIPDQIRPSVPKVSKRRLLDAGARLFERLDAFSVTQPTLSEHLLKKIS